MEIGSEMERGRERRRERWGWGYSAERDSEVNWACFSPPMASPSISRVHWSKGSAYLA